MVCEQRDFPNGVCVKGLRRSNLWGVGLHAATSEALAAELHQGWWDGVVREGWAQWWAASLAWVRPQVQFPKPHAHAGAQPLSLTPANKGTGVRNTSEKASFLDVGRIPQKCLWGFLQAPPAYLCPEQLLDHLLTWLASPIELLFLWLPQTFF